MRTFGVLDYSASSGPTLSYRAVGTTAAPVSVTTTISTQGILPPLVPLVIPANTLSIGSKITVQLKVQHTGTTQSDTLYVRFGRTGGTADPIVFSTTFTPVAAVLLGVVELDIDVTGTTTYLASWFRTVSNVGTAGNVTEISDSTLLRTADLFLAFTYTTPAASADTFSILAYDVQVYGATT
jgi:hypothetical protein